MSSREDKLIEDIKAHLHWIDSRKSQDDRDKLADAIVRDAELLAELLREPDDDIRPD